MTIETELQNLQEAIGPVRVKTPNLEVEMHPILDLLKAQQKTKTRTMSMGTLGFSVATPKAGNACADSRNTSRYQ